MPRPIVGTTGRIKEYVPTFMSSAVRRERSKDTARPRPPILAAPLSVNQTLPGFRSR